MLRFKHMPTALALGMLALTLIVYNLGGWYLYELSRDMAERVLDRKLEAIGRTAALDLNANSAPLLILCNPETGVSPALDLDAYEKGPGGLEQMRAQLAALCKANHLEDATILGRNRVALVSSDEATTPGTPPSALDALLIEESFTSRSVTRSPYYRFAGRDQKRCYAPLLDAQGFPTAVLRVSSGVEYFAEQKRMLAYLLAIAGLGSLLLAGVAVALYRLFVSAVRSEQAMADADRLQSLGTLAAGLAHEIRNPLGIIRAISEELKEELEDEPDRQELVSDITGEVIRLNDLVNQFLGFAKPGSAGAAVQPFSLAEALEDVVALVRKDSRGDRVRFVCETGDSISPLRMEEKSIRQVLLNVLLNARESIEANGEIHVQLDRWGRFARVRVRDTGRGMDSGQIKSAFDPFFTTKPHGTGLGLSISRNIVVRYGGQVTLESDPGRGTTVTVLLPVVEP
jgi:signal transduction histidine kinase